MKDICPKIDKVLREDSLAIFILEFCADYTLDYLVSSKTVLIEPYAFYQSESRLNSLEYIFKRSYQKKLEIPFIGIMDEKTLTVSEFIRGEDGDAGVCDWEKGSLLKKAYSKAEKLNKKVSLGHTHPYGFGAVCSIIHYKAKDYRCFIKEKKLLGLEDKISKKILETKLYKKYGGDYSIMWTMFEEIPLISKFAWIMSPGENQIGVFEIREKGKIIYHPWKIL